jgi:chromosome segregation ATPase
MLKTIGFDINAELMTLVAKREDLESTIEKLTINKSELESKLTLVSDEHLVLTASVKTMNQTIEENKEEIAKLESQKQLLISEIESLKAENNSLIASKVAFVESKKALAQKEEHIKRIYQEAGVQFPI